MHRPRTARRLWPAVPAALLTLTLVACGDRAAESALDTRAEWSEAAVPESTQLAGERVSFAATLGRSGELPWLVAGVGADPGERDHARVWTETDEGWRWADLPLPEDRDATVSAAATDGATTWVAGWTWTAGDPVEPFLASSADREAWTRVELPSAAAERAFQPGALVSADGRLLVVGRDAEDQPALLLVDGKDGELIDLPTVPEGRDFDGFTGIAAVGSTLVAVAAASEPGKAGEPVVYRSTDGGATWTAALGPVAQPAGAAGVAVLEGVFIATGYQTDAAGTHLAAAWSSPDGVTWTAEAVPALDWDRDRFAPDEGEDFWLGSPSVAGGRLVASIATAYTLKMGAVGRDAAGAWSVLGSSSDWQVPGVGGTAAVGDDGSVVVSQSAHNDGRIGEITGGGRWKPVASDLGTLDQGIGWDEFLDTGAAPGLIGYTRVSETYGNGAWSMRNRLTRYAVDAGALVEIPWDPAETATFSILSGASSPAGASVLLGTGEEFGPDGNGQAVLLGWFRASPEAPWAPVGGLRGNAGDWVSRVEFVSNTWVAVGVRRADTHAGTAQSAGVWTSADGLAWSLADGPFASAAADDSSANGACALPGGDLLVVGETEAGAQSVPLAWRGSAGQWQRVDAAAFGDAFGSFSSCATVGDTTIVQGTSGGRATLWRTTDGVAFEAQTLGSRGDWIGAIRTIEGGFAAAGTRGSEGQRGAVVWLSADARTWTAVPVPSARVLNGADVLSDGKGGLVLAAGSSSSPEMWVLGNPGELFADA